MLLNGINMLLMNKNKYFLTASLVTRGPSSVIVAVVVVLAIFLLVAVSVLVRSAQYARNHFYSHSSKKASL